MALHAWQDLRGSLRQIVKSSDYRGEGCTCACCGGGRGALGARQNGAVVHPANTAGVHTASGRPPVDLSRRRRGCCSAAANPPRCEHQGTLPPKGQRAPVQRPGRGFIGPPGSALSPVSNTAPGATQSQMPRMTRGPWRHADRQYRTLTGREWVLSVWRWAWRTSCTFAAAPKISGKPS